MYGTRQQGLLTKARPGEHQGHSGSHLRHCGKFCHESRLDYYRQQALDCEVYHQVGTQSSALVSLHRHHCRFSNQATATSRHMNLTTLCYYIWTQSNEWSYSQTRRRKQISTKISGFSHIQHRFFFVDIHSIWDSHHSHIIRSWSHDHDPVTSKKARQGKVLVVVITVSISHYWYTVSFHLFF